MLEFFIQGAPLENSFNNQQISKSVEDCIYENFSYKSLNSSILLINAKSEHRF